MVETVNIPSVVGLGLGGLCDLKLTMALHLVLLSSERMVFDDSSARNTSSGSKSEFITLWLRFSIVIRKSRRLFLWTWFSMDFALSIQFGSHFFL